MWFPDISPSLPSGGILWFHFPALLRFGVTVWLALSKEIWVKVLHHFWLKPLKPKLPLQWCLRSIFVCLFVCLLGPYPWHMEVPRLGIESELQLPAYSTTATAMWDPSCICDLHHSSWQCWILNPQSKARDQTCVLMDTSQICFTWATTGTPSKSIVK